MLYLLDHTKLGFCIWDILALIIVLAIVVTMIVKIHNQKKLESTLEDEISSVYADHAEEAEREFRAESEG